MSARLPHHAPLTLSAVHGSQVGNPFRCGSHGFITNEMVPAHRAEESGVDLIRCHFAGLR